ncbi:hypothetical protein NL676_009762 [Syzygium grande]|nr:hypothetical protein NL676_009762 [Syzygium grande]
MESKRLPGSRGKRIFFSFPRFQAGKSEHEGSNRALAGPKKGGFFSHCGWNSTVEALGGGVPFLAWPIRGDQFYNAKLVAHPVNVGYRVSDDDLVMVKKEEIVKGIDKLMSNEEVKERAAKASGMFQGGFPACALADLDAFINFLT